VGSNYNLATPANTGKCEHEIKNMKTSICKFIFW